MAPKRLSLQNTVPELYELDDSDDEAPLVPRYVGSVVDSVGDWHEDKDVEDEPEEKPHPCAFAEFAESNGFQLFTGVVIIFNIGVMSQEYLHPTLRKDVVLWRFNQVVLCFYVFEVTVRLLWFQGNFFCSHERWWNAMDLCIVFSGMLDQWIMPILVYDCSTYCEGSSFQHDITNLIRFLRVFRILRLLKLFRVVLTVDLSWTESPWFQTLMGIVIAFNAVIMGLETDIESKTWWWVEQALLIIYTFELFVRLRRLGWTFFWEDDDMVWNWLDFLIVGSAIVDQWMLPVLVKEGGSAMKKVGQLIMLIRMFRLLRILRLVRLVRAIRPLFLLSQAVVAAMQSMFWVLVLTFVGLYGLAIPITRIVGKSDLLKNEDDPGTDRAREMFGTIADSMFTLFGIMNSQEWGAVAPLFDPIPWFKPFFIVFTIYASWALLSVMTGVVSDSMFAVRTHEKGISDVEVRRRLKQELQVLLQPASVKAPHHDHNHEGFVHRKSHRMLPLEREELVTTVHAEGFKDKLTKVTNVNPDELIMVFDMLDITKKEKMSFDEFMEGLYIFNEAVSGKSLLKVEHEFRRKMITVEAGFATNFQKVLKLVDEVEKEGMQQQAEIIRLLEAAPSNQAGHAKPRVV